MRSIVIVLFLSIWLSSTANPQSVESEDVIKIDTTLVSIPVVVSDRKGRYVSGLTAKDFTIFQDGKEQEVGFFATEEEPVNVALLLDTSRSTVDVIDKIKAAAVDFVSLLETGDRAMIVTFDSRVSVLSKLTGNRIELERAIRGVEIGERFGTVMRDAVKEVVDRRFAGEKGRKAIILLTDGKDFGSREDKADLLDSLEESDTLLYSVFFKTSMGMQNNGVNRRGNRGGNRGTIYGRRGGNRRPGAADREKELDKDAIEYLKEMSELTSGRFYKKDVTDLPTTFEIIADELRKQYRIGFYPFEDESVNKVHQIKVKVARKEVSVRARSTYRSAK